MKHRQKAHAWIDAECYGRTCDVDCVLCQVNDVAKAAFRKLPPGLIDHLRRLKRAADVCGCRNCKLSWESAVKQYGEDL